MRTDPLPKGCEVCYQQLASRNFGGMRARFFDHLVGTTSAGVGEHGVALPKVLEFEISNVCNLECTMCSGLFPR